MKRMMFKVGWAVLVCGLHGFVGAADMRADVRLPALISDHAVLQQGMAVAIWGTAENGESVTVKFRGQQVSATAAADGKWRVLLDPMDAGGPFEMTISGHNSITLRDVMVGEVWICSGQSNMEWPVSRAMNSEQEIAQAGNPRIRFLTVKRAVSDKPLEDVSGSWELSTPESVKEFSAVGYFFGREIQRSIEAPVGLIDSSWGGTPAESWTSDAALRADRFLDPILWQWKRTLAEYPSAKQRYERQLKEWEEQSARARAEGKPVPQRPAPPQGPGHPWTPSGLYNAMIAPLIPLAMRGAIWYQGESNARPYRSFEYRRLFQTMIEDWRRAWDQPFPFLFVQLANFMQRKSEPEDSSWAELRESQSHALGLPNTGMAVIIDIGEADDIHPKNKQEVGRRLSLSARAIAYGEDLVYSGPVYGGVKLEGKQIRIRFGHTGRGLEAKGGRLEGFAIAGKDRRFVWAEAMIEGNTVVVSSPQVPSPVAVRYAWADNPGCNLYNRDGLPASPFRTDDWSETGAVNH